MARTIDAIVREHLGTNALLICQLQAQIEELREEVDRLKSGASNVPQVNDNQGQHDGRDSRDA